MIAEDTAIATEGHLEMDQQTILVVDDEPNIREVLTAYLERELYRVLTAATGDDALLTIELEQPDLIVLDLMLPRVDGLEITRRVRAKSNVPIIMLTARGDETDKLIGLGLGADDYLSKPFSPRELVARVKAVLRRSNAPAPVAGAPSAAGVLKFPGLRINSSTRNVEVNGQRIDLTAKEFDLLLFLARNAGQVFSRSQLLDQVWDYTYYGDASTVTVHVRRLREKVEPDPVRPRFIKTVWGVGYKFDPEGESAVEL